MIVMKFGGSSVESAERIKNVVDIIKKRINQKPIVVISAVGGITDMLIEAAEKASKNKPIEDLILKIKNKHKKILKELDLDESLVDNDLDSFEKLLNKIKKEKKVTTEIMDNVQSFGEQMSTKILAAYLTKNKINSKAFNAFDIGMITNSDFGNSEPLEKSYIEINKNIKKINNVPIITGFIGKTEDGRITTLGRGGSDYSAAIIGAAIMADEIQIWTDVDGIMSTDPKIVDNAKTIEKVSFAEASELAYFGAKVLHPKTILPAMNKDIPVKVLNSYKPENKGTTILNKANKSEQIVKAIAHKKNVTLINVGSTRMLGAYGFLAKLFEIFSKYKKSVDVISTSEINVSLTIDNDKNIKEILNEIKKIANVNSEKNKAIICIVGEGIKNTPDVAGKVFTELGKNNINIEMISQGASEINITLVVNEKDVEKAVKALHKEFFGWYL